MPQAISSQNWHEGPRLIRGVAGSGKTIVLANNLARRLQSTLKGTNALPVASPNLNGRVERFIGTIKHECLSKFILFGERHVDHIVSEWSSYYNTVRSHTERDHLPPKHTVPDEVLKLNRDQITIKSYVGGLVISFERKAA